MVSLPNAGESAGLRLHSAEPPLAGKWSTRSAVSARGISLSLPSGTGGLAGIGGRLDVPESPCLRGSAGYA
jgi:hypothetical protein